MKRKTALITGGVSGIGKVTAERLAKEGYQIVVNYRNSKEKAHQFVTYLKEMYGQNHIAIQGDVSKSSDCKRIVSEALEYFQTIDILIHNAGPYVHERKTMSEYTDDEWDYIINGNLNGVFYLTKALLPVMRKEQWGRIITIGFDRVETAPGWIYRSAFAAAKSGLASLTKTLAIEEASNGITINMLCPGDIIGDWKEKHINEAQNVYDDKTPVGRPGTGEDIARVVSFLCEGQSDFITGSIIPVTGNKDVLGKKRNE